MGTFDQSARRYLNDWYRYDRGFLEGMRRANREERRLCLIEITRNYRIARNLRTIPEEPRLAKALYLLEKVANSTTQTNVDAMVARLAANLQTHYGQMAVSAASKLLWFCQQSPVVIFDSLAVEALQQLCGTRYQGREYAEYRSAWREQFDKREGAIRAACERLPAWNQRSQACDLSEPAVRRLVGKRWFRERVFDKYLWLRGA